MRGGCVFYQYIDSSYPDPADAEKLKRARSAFFSEDISGQELAPLFPIKVDSLRKSCRGIRPATAASKVFSFRLYSRALVWISWPSTYIQVSRAKTTRNWKKKYSVWIYTRRATISWLFWHMPIFLGGSNIFSTYLAQSIAANNKKRTQG